METLFVVLCSIGLAIFIYVFAILLVPLSEWIEYRKCVKEHGKGYADSLYKRDAV